MSKELKNISDSVMGKIRHGKVSMRPRAYFIMGSLFTFVGLVLSILTSIFLIGLLRFSLRSNGPMREIELEELLSYFSWLGPVCALLGLVIGISLLRRYDFSYKLNFKIMIIGFIMAIIAAGWVLDMTGLNDVLLRQGPVQGVMKQYLEKTTNQQNLYNGGGLINKSR